MISHIKRYKDYFIVVLFLIIVSFVIYYSNHHLAQKNVSNLSADSTNNNSNQGIDNILNSNNQYDVYCTEEAKTMLENELKNEDQKTAMEVINNKDELMNKLSTYFITCKKLKSMGAELNQ
jgi:hypothetical protein